MHPYAIDRMVQERRDELARLGRADRGARVARREPDRRRRLPADWFSALTARLPQRAGRPPVLGPVPSAPGASLVTSADSGGE